MEAALSQARRHHLYSMGVAQEAGAGEEPKGDTRWALKEGAAYKIWRRCKDWENDKPNAAVEGAQGLRMRNGNN